MDGERKEGGNSSVGVILGEAGDQQLPPPGERKEEIFALAAKVFGNDMIRETIVSYAIFEGSGSLDRSTVCCLRTLGKGWNDLVCKRLHKSGRPLFKLCLSGQLYLNNVHCGNRERYREIMNKFTETFVSSADILGRGPTFHLVLFEAYFPRENYNSLYNFLVWCGQGIVELEAWINRNGGTLNGIFRDISLPSLHKATFDFVQMDLDGGVGQTESITHLLQSVLSGASCLKELKMGNVDRQDFPSSVFKSIVFPRTLQQIFFYDFGSADLDMLLVRTSIPNLSTLILGLCHNPMAAGLLEGILNNVRRSLKKIILNGNLEDEDAIPAIVHFGFPIMEKLESFQLCSKYCQLEPGTRILETYLPKLRVLKLEGQSSDLLGRWTNYSRVSTLEELSLSSREVNLSLDAATMKQIHLGFPNVTKLELEFEQIPVSGLQYMFMEMCNLQELKIIQVDPGEGQKPIDWDSVLTGTPMELTAALRAEVALSDKIQFNNVEDRSIRNLTELHTLSLRTIPSGDTDGEAMRSLVTEVAFHFAFLKMPRLQKLEFSGRFSVSSEMADKWRLSGRLLNNTE